MAGTNKIEKRQVSSQIELSPVHSTSRRLGKSRSRWLSEATPPETHEDDDYPGGVMESKSGQIPFIEGNFRSRKENPQFLKKRSLAVMFRLILDVSPYGIDAREAHSGMPELD